MKSIPLPKPVQQIYRAVAALERQHPSRKFTPDGHLVGSIGEVIAAEAFDLRLLPMSQQAHDARDKAGRLVQIKLTAGTRVSMYDESERLLVLRIVSPTKAEVVYDGCGRTAWKAASKRQKNGQKSIAISTLRSLASHDEGNPWQKANAIAGRSRSKSTRR